MSLNELLFECLKDTAIDFSAFKSEQNKRMPYAVYTIISNTRNNNLSVKDAFRDTRYQIDIYAESMEDVVIFGELYENTLLDFNKFHCIINDGFSELDDESKDFRYSIDFNLHTI